MKYVEEINNDTVQRAFITVQQLQQQALVESCTKELEELIKSHKIQDIAVWIMVIQKLNSQLLSRAVGIQDAVIVE